MDEVGAGLTPHEAYGRVTDPERFRVLHDAALGEIDRLVATYDVQRTDGVDLHTGAARQWPGSRTIALEPAGGGARAVIVLTPFPGVGVCVGRDQVAAFPACGCDACDEQPADLADQMADLLADVAAGRFTEPGPRHRFRPGRRTVAWPAWRPLSRPS